MKYTKEQLQGMSDVEVNKALAGILGVMWHIKPNEFSDKWRYCANYEGLDGVQLPDYCKNPNDIMPLAFEHGISLIKVNDGYVACKHDAYIDVSYDDDIDGICADGHQFGHKNPLRAIACCLILVLQDKGDL